MSFVVTPSVSPFLASFSKEVKDTTLSRNAGTRCLYIEPRALTLFPLLNSQRPALLLTPGSSFASSQPFSKRATTSLEALIAGPVSYVTAACTATCAPMVAQSTVSRAQPTLKEGRKTELELSSRPTS